MKDQWWDKSWNFFGGCSPVSKGCQNCWAARLACGRLKNHPLYKGLAKNGKWTGEIRTCLDINRPNLLEKPLHRGIPTRYFVADMVDLFNLPFEFIDKVFGIMSVSLHTFLILTKRPDRAKIYLSDDDVIARMLRQTPNWNPEKRYCRDWPFPHIHLGATVENKDNLWRIKELPKIPAAVRFVSLEPMLGEINIIENLAIWICELCKHQYQGYELNWHKTRTGYFGTCPQCGGTTDGSYLKVWKRLIDGVILGCETGPRARLCEIEDMLDVAEQCKAAGVPLFVKAVPIDGKPCRDIEKFPKQLQRRELPK